MAQPSPGRRGTESLWRNLLIGEGIVAILILAIFTSDYSPVLWVGVAIVVVTTPLVLREWLRSRDR